MRTKLHSISTKLSNLPQQQHAEQQQRELITEENAGSLVEAELYPIRTHRNGILSRVPEDFEFPKGGVSDCWLKWNIGDTERRIPPLRALNPRDFAFMDAKPKTTDEMRGQRGKFKANRRPSRKIYHDIKFLCNYIEKEAVKQGMNARDRTPNNVRRMFEKVEPILLGNDTSNRGTQLKWSTVKNKLQKKLHAEKNQNNTSSSNT